MPDVDKYLEFVSAHSHYSLLRGLCWRISQTRTEL